jgi:ADP-heptose:LPS heptosyltransferase
MKHTPAISAGRLNLKQTAALLKRSRLLICNNSGPMHIAAALNVPTVSILARQTRVSTGRGAAAMRYYRAGLSAVHAIILS